MRLSCLLMMIVLLGCSATEKDQDILVDANATELLSVVDEYKGEKPVVVNFWATWCAPCVEEFPYIMELNEAYGNDFELIFVSGDFNEAKPEAEKFLKEQGVDFTTYFKTGNDNEFISTFSDDWTGALPFTVIYDTDGSVSSSWEGKAEFEKFESELLKVIIKG